MQELRCSCKGRGGRKQVNLSPGSRSSSPAFQRWVAGVCSEGNQTASVAEVVLKGHVCPDVRVTWALHILLLFCGVIFVGGGKHTLCDSQVPSTVPTRSDQASSVISFSRCQAQSRDFCLWGGREGAEVCCRQPRDKPPAPQGCGAGPTGQPLGLPLFSPATLH